MPRKYKKVDLDKLSRAARAEYMTLLHRRREYMAAYRQAKNDIIAAAYARFQAKNPDYMRDYQRKWRKQRKKERGFI